MVPGIGKQLQAVAVRLAETAENSNVSVGALLASAALLTVPTLATALSGIAASLNYLSLWHLPSLLAALVRKKKRSWGVVFDSVTKQPLDPAILTLKNSDGDEFYAVSDIYGRYGFLVEPGQYTLAVKKTNYTFPSEKMVGQKNTLYDDLYFGGVIDIGKEDVISKNIPLDPVREDWNQANKPRRIFSTRSPLFYRFSRLVFYSGFAWAIIAFLLIPGLWNGVVLTLFILLFVFKLWHYVQRDWGVVKDAFGDPVSGAIVRLKNLDAPKQTFPPVVTKQQGRYNFLVTQGRYELTIDIADSNREYEKVLTVGPITVDKEEGYVGQNIKLPFSQSSQFKLEQRRNTLLIVVILLQTIIMLALFLR